METGQLMWWQERARSVFLGEIAKRERAALEFDGDEVAEAEAWAAGDLQRLGGLMGEW